MAHKCHAAGCSREIPKVQLMCLPHWRMVPRNLQRAVWRHYRPGQCDDWQITHEYAVAATAAIEAIAIREGRTTDEIKKATAVYRMLDPQHQTGDSE